MFIIQIKQHILHNILKILHYYDLQIIVIVVVAAAVVVVVVVVVKIQVKRVKTQWLFTIAEENGHLPR